MYKDYREQLTNERQVEEKAKLFGSRLRQTISATASKRQAAAPIWKRHPRWDPGSLQLL
jgi:hypothetical protein